MVHDPRVSHCLARLGGVYRDPTRVDRDAATLLKSSVGAHLQPIISEMVENTGTSSNVLVLQGTVAMHFRGNTYQQLVDVYLPGGYPNRPPVCYVRLANPNMYLKENHRHVGSDGKVYLPYLHEWNRNSHNLVELVVAMSSVFSADPPVFTRATPPPSSAARPPPPASMPATSVMASTSTAANTSTSMASSWQSTDSEREAIMAVEIAEANEAAEAARRAEMEEKERKRREAELERQRKELERREGERRESVKQVVDKKLRTYLLNKIQEVRMQVQGDMRDNQRLEMASQKIAQQREHYMRRRDELQNYNDVVDKKLVDIEAWLENNKQKEAAAAAAAAAAASSSSENGGSQKMPQQPSVDDAVQPANPLHGQMIELSAENQTLSDALYFLDRALYQGKLDCESHLKRVRQLAKRQFLVKAHLLKVKRCVAGQQQR